MSDPNAQPSQPSEAAESAFERAYPKALRDGERRLLAGRQREAGAPWSLGRLVGVGLSGGGIRSATFALGVFQAMARKRGLLRQIDFLSTVSGGGYFGSFFGRLLTRDYVKTADDVERVLLGEEKPQVVGFLRENGRYMSPNGAGDSLLFGAAVLRNWVSVNLVLGLFILALFLGLQSLRSGLEVFLGEQDRFLPPMADQNALIWWSPLIWLPLVTFVFAAFPIGWAYWLVEPESRAIKEGAGEKDAPREVSAIPPVAALALVFVVSLWLAVSLRDQANMAAPWGALAAVAFLTFIVWKIAPRSLPDKQPMDAERRSDSERDEVVYRNRKMDQALYRNRGLRNRLSLWLTTALVVTALLLALALVDSLGQSVYAVLAGDSSVRAWLTALVSSLGALSALSAFGRRLSLFFSNRSGAKGGRPSLPLKLIASVAALLLVLLLLVSLDLTSHAIAWGGGVPKGAPARLLKKAKDEHVYVEVRGRATPAGVDLRLRDGESDDASGPKAAGNRDPLLVLVGFASTLLLSILFGQTWPFVNRSTQQPLYGARLTRAYLGASNEKRWEGTNITETVEGDDFDLARYWPPPAQNGAPIHLINVTINETIDGQSQVQQQDRKGIGLALGPWGLSAGVKHHVVLPLGDEKKMLSPEDKPVFAIYPASPDFRVFDYKIQEGENRPRFTGEMLPLGTWVSISGAAFSTGTGMNTSLGLSLLTGFGNVRLGRWWDSGVERDKKEQDPPASEGTRKAKRKLSLRIEDALARLFPVQTYMLDEFLARFPGTSRRHWYLSDGGHFENMGGYELLRRRLPFIVIVDGEQDADYTFGGLSNMVRKARIDFGAEVHFLIEEELDNKLDKSVRPYIGTLEQLRRGTWENTESEEKKPHGTLKEPNQIGHSLAHAALARVKYTSPQPGEPAESWLLYVKPTLTGREPVDLLEYHRAHPAFPHEPTIDQFFDEAQWESYRRLGEYIGEVLFGQLDQLVPDDDPKSKPNLLKEPKKRPATKESVPSYS